MALEVSGAGEGAVAAGVGTGEPLLAGRSASSMRGGCVQGPRGSGLGVGGGVGVGVGEVGCHVHVEALVVREGGVACGEETRVDRWWHRSSTSSAKMFKKKNLPVLSCSSVHRICI